MKAQEQEREKTHPPPRSPADLKKIFSRRRRRRYISLYKIVLFTRSAPCIRGCCYRHLTLHTKRHQSLPQSSSSLPPTLPPCRRYNGSLMLPSTLFISFISYFLLVIPISVAPACRSPDYTPATHPGRSSPCNTYSHPPPPTHPPPKPQNPSSPPPSPPPAWARRSQ